jgi:hypothetical protein
VVASFSHFFYDAHLYKKPLFLEIKIVVATAIVFLLMLLKLFVSK